MRREPAAVALHAGDRSCAYFTGRFAQLPESCRMSDIHMDAALLLNFIYVIACLLNADPRASGIRIRTKSELPIRDQHDWQNEHAPH